MKFDKAMDIAKRIIGGTRRENEVGFGQVYRNITIVDLNISNNEWRSEHIYCTAIAG